MDIPVICNGGSKEIDRFSDIAKFKKLCGTNSIMIARAAEWNASIFRPQGMLPLMDVINRYLELAIDYDTCANNAKYCVQNMLRDLQESEMGRRFLDAQTMEQLCDVFGLKDYCKQKQLEFKQKGMAMRRDLAPTSEDGPMVKRLKLDDGRIEENVVFIRSNYLKDTDLPKSLLHTHTKKKLRTIPTYESEQNDRLFRAVLTLGSKKYSSSFWEKNKRCAEQGAALVCMLHLGLVSKDELVENGSMTSYDVNIPT